MIRTKIQVGDMSWDIEITLTNRDEMGFRMLLVGKLLRHLLVNLANLSFGANNYKRTNYITL